jgi:hypothetical protein
VPAATEVYAEVDAAKAAVDEIGRRPAGLLHAQQGGAGPAHGGTHMDRLTPEQYRERLIHIQKIAQTATAAAKNYRVLLPVPAGLSTVLNSFRAMDRLLYPDRLPWAETAGSAGPRRRVLESTVGDITGIPVWQPIADTLFALLLAHDALLSEHGWGLHIADGRTDGENYPAAAPPLSENITRLADSAARLHELAEEALASESPTDARGQWLYDQRVKCPPMPWKQIVTELANIAEERGWETLTSKPAAATALRRWCEDHGKEFPHK